MYISVDHAVTKLKSGGDSSGGKIDASSKHLKDENARGASEGLQQHQQQTYDEKTNAWISWATAKLLHLISFELQQVAIIISGAGADSVKRTRKSFSSPREANLAFARLPRRRRALTVVGSDSISLSFSPDAKCNALLCFVGLHVKVGTPVVADELNSANDVPYAWHTVSHPFHLVAEVKGILPFFVWAINYDHYWPTRAIGLTLTSSEIAVSLSPDHLHTVLLHLDDYTDPMSSYNSWIMWLKETLSTARFDISEREKELYCNNYARIKGKNNNAKPNSDNEKSQLSLPQMKELEKRMNRFDIMSLRCFSMRDNWRIPIGNKDLEDFLRNSQSSICERGDEDRATSLDQQSPFQRIYPSPLHALVTLIRESSSILAPHVSVESSVNTLHIDFPQTTTKSIPSTITVSGVTFDIDQESTLFVGDKQFALDSPRSFLNLSLDVSSVKWDVAVEDDMEVSLDEELPLFRDRSHVGMVYMMVSCCSYSRSIPAVASNCSNNCVQLPFLFYYDTE